MRADPFSVEVDLSADDAVLSLSGECDMATVPLLIEAIAALEAKKVIVDLAGLTFLDSTGLAGLVQAKNCLAERGCAMSVRGATGPALRVLEITGIDDVLKSA